jgi:hypothetical protein
MDSGLAISKIWFDDDMIEVQVKACDGTSQFSIKAYVSYPSLDELTTKLESFRLAVHGGLLDFSMGEFGPEYVNGAFHGRFHFVSPSKLCITCRMESEFFSFGGKNVASSATLHLITEPALLDRFIEQFKALNAKNRTDATLETI